MPTAVKVKAVGSESSDPKGRAKLPKLALKLMSGLIVCDLHIGSNKHVEMMKSQSIGSGA